METEVVPVEFVAGGAGGLVTDSIGRGEKEGGSSERKEPEERTEDEGRQHDKKRKQDIVKAENQERTKRR